MSFTVIYDIWCDVCGEWQGGKSGIGKRALRRKVRAFGWTYKLGIGDLCTRCTEERKAWKTQ